MGANRGCTYCGEEIRPNDEVCEDGNHHEGFCCREATEEDEEDE